MGGKELKADRWSIHSLGIPRVGQGEARQGKARPGHFCILDSSPYPLSREPSTQDVLDEHFRVDAFVGGYLHE